MNKDFRYYMHDGPNAFSFELAGHLSDRAARELEQARRTASSTMSDRSLIVDLSYITGVDNEGRAMLHGWYAGGAQLIATRPAARKIVESITRQDPALITEAAQSQTWRPVLAASFLAMVSLFAPTRTFAANLRPVTVQARKQYVQADEPQNRAQPVGENRFHLSTPSLALKERNLTLPG